MSLFSPDRIGRYQLERPIGSGSFGVVWLAHDDTLQAPVALKVMAENWAFRLDLRERFLSEARLLRRAASSRVVQVYDIGELPDERPYFVMEYADRGTLADKLADAGGPLPTAEALWLAAEAARGVAALHEAGIVHRDIKPSNVLIRKAPGGRDRVLVADLGLAKSLAQASGLTLTAGSAGYMAPEQAEPGEDGIDERADVYGLGALAYHLVTGAVPGRPGTVTRPDRVRPGLPDGVRRVIMRALEPDRDRRWASAARFADELDALAAQVEPAARAGHEGRRAVTGTGGGPRRRPPRTVLAVAGALGLVVGGAVLATHLPGRSSVSVRVGDTTGRISVQVPAAWARQLRGAGWDPRWVGLDDSHQPGLLVAGDVSKWQDLRSDVNGVLVGMSTHGDLAARIAEQTHTTCAYRGSRAYSGGTWHGRVRRWDACDGGTRSIEEISLSLAKGGLPRMYVEIRQSDGQDATDQILAGLRVTG
jgi:hypothetical protein